MLKDEGSKPCHAETFFCFPHARIRAILRGKIMQLRRITNLDFWKGRTATIDRSFVLTSSADVPRNVFGGQDCLEKEEGGTLAN